MSRPRKDICEITEVNLKRHKGRYAERETVRPVGRLGPPSPWLTPEQKKCWRQMVKCAPCVLGANDRGLLELAVVLRTKLAKGDMSSGEMANLIVCLTKLGMVPANRRPTEEKTEPDEWADFREASAG